MCFSLSHADKNEKAQKTWDASCTRGFLAKISGNRGLFASEERQLDIVYCLPYTAWMTNNLRLKGILARISKIRRMERGRISTINRSKDWSPVYQYHVHQVWENGKATTRYIRKDETAALQKLIDANQEFRRAVQEYEDLVVGMTRSEWKKRRRRVPISTASAAQKANVSS